MVRAWVQRAGAVFLHCTHEPSQLAHALWLCLQVGLVSLVTGVCVLFFGADLRYPGELERYKCLFMPRFR